MTRSETFAIQPVVALTFHVSILSTARWLNDYTQPGFIAPHHVPPLAVDDVAFGPHAAPLALELAFSSPGLFL